MDNLMKKKKIIGKTMTMQYGNQTTGEKKIQPKQINRKKDTNKCTEEK